MGYRTKQRILNRKISNGQKILKKMFSILSHQGNAKTTLRYHHTPIRMTKIKNTNDSLFWGGFGVKETLVGMQTCTTTLEVSMTVSQKTDNLPQNPAIPLLGIYSKDAQSYYKSICSNMFIAALFVIARTQKYLDTPQLING